MLFSDLTEIGEAIADYGPLAQREWNRLDGFEAYYRGIHRAPYTPETVTREFRELVHRSVTNLTRLIVNTLTQRLIVDGFRSSKTAMEDAPQWEWWQANGMDARQKALYDEVAKHGYAGMLVFPAEPGADAPVMRPVSPREWWLWFENWSDDWPALALSLPARPTEPNQPINVAPDDWQQWVVLDERARYVVHTSGRNVVLEAEDVHDLGHVPIVPYRNTWDLTRAPTGEIEPAIAINDRLNQTVFDLLVAQTYAASPQKWATGMALPTGPDGKPLLDLRAWAKSLWLTSDENAKFGSLPEANLKNIVEAIEQALRMYGLMTQTPPHYLLGDLVNLPLALDTVVPTPTGLSTIGELKAGDQVLAPNGTAINVTGKTPVFLGHDCYKLTFDSGAEVVADAAHRWVTTHFVSPNSNPYKHGTVTESVTTEDIFNSLNTCMGGLNHWIPVAEPFDGPEQTFDIPPYVLGLWLADGDHINGVITKGIEDADELVEHLRSEGEIVTVRPYTDAAHANCRLITISYDHDRCPQGHVRPRGTHDVTHHCRSCAALRYRLKRYGEPMPPAVNVSFVKRLKRNGLWKNKHIPEQYFQGSLKQRLALLQGFMDGDGSISHGGTVALTSHRERLALDVARLIRSVGMKVTPREGRGANFEKTDTVRQWRLQWSARDYPVFRLARKLSRQRTIFDETRGRGQALHRHYIVDCVPVPSVPVQCVTVDSTEHLFLVTDFRITSGNSAEALLAADTTLAKKVQDHQTILGEAHEQMFRLAGVAMGDESAATDQEAQVWWRDTEPRSIAQQVDALGKMAQMLQVPVQALWEKVPGTTGGDLSLWRAEAAKERLRQRLEGVQPAQAVAQNTQRMPGVPGGTPADRALATNGQ